jgi:hypothetical protein
VSPVIPLTDAGWRARAALAAAGGRARVVAVLTESVYLAAGEEMVWLGGAGSALHGRAMLTSGSPAAALHAHARADVLVDDATARVWTPPAVPPTARATWLAAGQRLCERVAAIGSPQGFGVLLAGACPEFPLGAAADPARALARACAADDPVAASHAATALVGLGPGLTPAGDDLVGAAFFARAIAGLATDPAWPEAAAHVCAQARTTTHPISATLLADLCAGAGHAPLHDLAAASAAGDDPALLDAAARLVRIGHSSGWDMLTGFVAGLGTLPHPR